jgi:hypothetical protein
LTAIVDVANERLFDIDIALVAPAGSMPKTALGNSRITLTARGARFAGGAPGSRKLSAAAATLIAFGVSSPVHRCWYTVKI